MIQHCIFLHAYLVGDYMYERASLYYVQYIDIPVQVEVKYWSEH